MQKFVPPQILKGFRDFLPAEALKRQYAVDIIRRTFERYGFEPIETPAIEYLDVFTGNIGEDEHLFYKFKDTGGRDVALRYDQTVPTCRFIAQHFNELSFPFKRYQIQTVWRAEKPQRGRYREFLQCDADIFGVDDRASDAETVALTIDVYKNLGFKNPVAYINDRALYEGVDYKAIVAIDKLEKIGEAGVIAELVRKGYLEDDAKKILREVATNKPNKNLEEIFAFLNHYGMKENYRFAPTLARSFSYSTGTIWEIKVDGFDGGSLAGCERYDSLVSRFSDKKISGVGFAIGFDRTVLAMEELGLFPSITAKTTVLVTIFNPSTLAYSQTIAKELREDGINTDLYPNPTEKLEKQLKYADKKGIPYVVIAGPDEVKDQNVTIKNLKTREQKTIPLSQLPHIIAKEVRGEPNAVKQPK